MSAQQPQFKFRLPLALKDLLEAAAAVSGRSLTAEVVHRLQQSFERGSETDEEIESMAAKLAAIDDRMAQMDELQAELRKMLVAQAKASSA